MNTVRRYKDASGKELVAEWLAGLRDMRARAKIQARIDRLESGNAGDCEPVGEGVYELRIHYGPGYRVYFCNTGRQIVLLLCGGDKSTQQTDIKLAIACKHDFEERIK
jgi:putative addiction module killer protein